MERNFQNIDFVVPVFNEQYNIQPLVEHISSTLSNTFSKIYLIFVDDGSSDDTEKEIEICINNNRYINNNINIRYIRLSKNHGKDLAIKCGIDHSTSKLCAIIDGDLQHPPEKIIEAYEKIKHGYNIVHIVRRDNNFKPRFRKVSSFLFTKLINIFSESKIHLTDFQLFDNKVITAIKSFKETNYFNRGMVELIGLKSTEIFYKPDNRSSGKSKYSKRKLVNLAIDGLISVSTKPLRISIYIGLSIYILSFIYVLFMIIEKIFFGQPIPGFTTLALSIFFLGGIQLIFLGIIGEYVGRIFIETKRRPQYIIDHIKKS